uniref:Uncharacterized protein n=1 Tax=Opuntia streptacantha TaxID=393608 RepID=A0A7C9AWY4_OPUST
MNKPPDPQPYRLQPLLISTFSAVWRSDLLKSLRFGHHGATICTLSTLPTRICSSFQAHLPCSSLSSFPLPDFLRSMHRSWGIIFLVSPGSESVEMWRGWVQISHLLLSRARPTAVSVSDLGFIKASGWATVQLYETFHYFPLPAFARTTAAIDRALSDSSAVDPGLGHYYFPYGGMQILGL